MIVYFATSSGEFNYMLPLLKKTGGILVTESNSLYNFVTSYYSFVECHLDKMRNMSRYHPDVVVLAGNYGWVPKNVKLVQVFHGLTDKKSIYRKREFKDPHSLLFLTSCFIESYLPKWLSKFSLVSDDLWKPFKHLELDKHIKNRYDLLCLVGKHMEEKFRGLNLLTDTNWKPVGFPRLDCVINNELSRDEILNDLNLDPELKTVLYAPTWRGHQEMNLSSIADMGFEICESIDENMNFIFKPHPIVKRHSAFPEIVEQIEKHVKNQQNFVYPDAFTEIIPLLYVSDLLITDFSTVAIEYLAFDRPIIFADHLGDEYNDPNLVEVWIREAGEIVQNPNDFKNVIRRCLESPSEKSEIRRRYRDYFFYTLDGKASERAAKAIIELE